MKKININEDVLLCFAVSHFEAIDHEKILDLLKYKYSRHKMVHTPKMIEFQVAVNVRDLPKLFSIIDSVK